MLFLMGMLTQQCTSRKRSRSRARSFTDVFYKASPCAPPSRAPGVYVAGPRGQKFSHKPFRFEIPRIVTLGEIMLRLTTPRHQRFRQASLLEVEYGGGECNVGVSLANY